MAEPTRSQPRRENYFGGSFARSDPSTGRSEDRSGSRVVAVPEEFFSVLSTQYSAPALRAAGRAWGWSFAESLDRDLGQFHGGDYVDQAMAVFAADLGEAFAAYGWGRIDLDFTHAEVGLFLAAWTDSVEPVPLAEGLLAGLFSFFADEELACRAFVSNRFVIGRSDRLPETLDSREVARLLNQ